MGEYYFVLYLYYLFISPFLYSFVSGHSGNFFFVINNPAVNVRIQMSFWDSVFISFRYIPRSRNTRLYYSSILNFFRDCHTVFHSAYINLHLHQQCTSVSFSPHPQQHCYYLSSDNNHCHFNRNEVIANSGIDLQFPEISDVEHLIMDLLAICISLGKCLFSFFVHFLTGLFFVCFCYWVVWASYIFWIWTSYRVQDL